MSSVEKRLTVFAIVVAPWLIFDIAVLKLLSVLPIIAKAFKGLAFNGFTCRIIQTSIEILSRCWKDCRWLLQLQCYLIKDIFDISHWIWVQNSPKERLLMICCFRTRGFPNHPLSNTSWEWLVVGTKCVLIQMAKLLNFDPETKSGCWCLPSLKIIVPNCFLKSPIEF